MASRATDRTSSYGEVRSLTALDGAGVWLSRRAIERHADFRNARIADFGCGYEATLATSVLERVDSATLVDLSLAPALARHPKVTAIEGEVNEVAATLADRSFDVILCISVLEHLWEPQRALDEFARLLTPGGTLLVNVPTWRGKAMLELAVFRLGAGQREEIDDHKRYYDPRELWPLLVAAGFPPSHVRCYRHKLGLNTFAICRAPGERTTR